MKIHALVVLLCKLIYSTMHDGSFDFDRLCLEVYVCIRTESPHITCFLYPERFRTRSGKFPVRLDIFLD